MTDYIVLEVRNFSKIEMFNVEKDLKKTGYERLIVDENFRNTYAVFLKRGAKRGAVNCDFCTNVKSRAV